MSVEAAARFRITGRVQGVYFRASTCEQAQRLGLRGHAVNLRDGSVEVVAAGSAASLESLAAWLAHGPPMAEVEQVSREPVAVETVPQGFAVG